jgi:hypothetical protein
MPEKKEHRQVEQLPRPFGELDAVPGSLLESNLHRQTGHEGCDEHAGAQLIGGQQAKQGKRDHTELQPSVRDPLPAMGLAQQPAAGQPDSRSDQRAVPQLLHDESHQPCFLAVRALGQRDEKEQEGHGQAVVESGFHVERLANLHRHSRAVHDDLSQPGIRRREDGGQDARFRPRQLRKQESRRHRTQHDREQHADAEQTHRQGAHAAQHPQIRAAGVGIQQQYQADLGHAEEQLVTASVVVRLGQE